MWVESTRDHGSTFTFTLPIDATSKPTSLATVLARRPNSSLRLPLTGAMVLVIEDDAKSVDLLRIYLTEAGYAVEVAQDGAEGLEKVKRLAPDVVILDVLLPKVDGWAFLSQVKSDPATRTSRSSSCRLSIRRQRLCVGGSRLFD